MLIFANLVHSFLAFYVTVQDQLCTSFHIKYYFVCVPFHHGNKIGQVPGSNSIFVGLARTIYIRCIYGISGREIIKYTVMYGVYIRFWPTLHIGTQVPCSVASCFRRPLGMPHTRVCRDAWAAAEVEPLPGTHCPHLRLHRCHARQAPPPPRLQTRSVPQEDFNFKAGAYAWVTSTALHSRPRCALARLLASQNAAHH